MVARCMRALHTDPSPTAGEVLIMLGGPNPAEVRAGLDAMVAHIENGASIPVRPMTQKTPPSVAHVVSRTGSYLHQPPGSRFGDPMAYLVAPPLEATHGIDAALEICRRTAGDLCPATVWKPTTRQHF